MYKRLSIGRTRRDAISTVSKGDKIPVRGARTFTFTLVGNFSGTLKVQGSVLENPDASNDDHWFDLHSFSAKGHAHVVDKPCEWIRDNCTVATSGSGEIFHVGL